MTESTEKERAEFESRIKQSKSYKPELMNWDGSRYELDVVESAWCGFQMGAESARRAPVVPEENVSREKLEDWKRRVNTLASCGLKADRYRFGSALKQEIADAIAAAPEPKHP